MVHPLFALLLGLFAFAPSAAAQGSRLTIDARFVPPAAKPGDEVVLEVVCAIESGYHIYGAKDPSPTLLAIESPGGLQAKGNPQIPAGTPHEAFGVTNYWVAGAATLKQAFTVPKDAKAGAVKVQGAVEYMACTPDFCDPPAKDAFTATLTIIAPAAATPAVPAPRAGDGKVRVVAARFEPPVARAGEQVQLQVQIEVVDGWHVYGSRETTGIPIGLTAKDTGGLELHGGPVVPPGTAHELLGETSHWLASRFDLTQAFVVPAGAAPGERTVAGEMPYMACNDSSCLEPTAVTFTAVLTVAAGNAAPQAGAAPVQGGDGKVRVTARFEPKVARAGERVQLVVQVDVVAGWHVYGSRETTGIPIGLTAKDSDGLEPQGSPVVPPGEAHALPGETSHWLGGRFDLRQAFVVPAGAAPGERTVAGEVPYQACTESSCLRATAVTFTAKLTVEAGPVRDEHRPAAPVKPPVDGGAVPPRDPDPSGQPTNGGGAPAKPIDLSDAKVRYGIVGDGVLRQPKFAFGGSTADGSLWSLILLCIFGGLIALVMPCTYPMIPITFSFFTKQADARGGKVMSLALAYGAGIVAIFVVIGVAVGEIIVPFAAHWATNLVIGAAFVVFALALFGFVNLQPPRFLTNAAGKASATGGLLGVFLMGATLVITSFTCTAPIVGSLLAGVARGETSRLHVAIGMAAFGLTMAAPFVALALLPGRVKRLPRSGEWMHTLKVALGFVELAAALKFLSNVDIALDLRLLPREVFLMMWAFTFVLLGLFLFGLFRGRGEPMVGVTAARNGSGVLSLAFACYCLLGATGIPLDYVMTAFEPNYQLRPVEEHTIVVDNHEAAMKLAREQKKYVLVNFTGFT